MTLEKEYSTKLEQSLSNNEIIVYNVEDPIIAFDIIARETIDIFIVSYTQKRISWIDYIGLVNIVKPLVLCAVVSIEDDDIELEILESIADFHILENKNIEITTKLIMSNLSTFSFKANSILKYPLQLEEQTSFGNIVIRSNLREVTLADKPVDLTSTELQILIHLIKEKKRVVSREDLLKLMYDELYESKESRIIDVHIKNLRSKVGFNLIQSVRGQGYRWIG